MPRRAKRETEPVVEKPTSPKKAKIQKEVEPEAPPAKSPARFSIRPPQESWPEETKHFCFWKVIQTYKILRESFLDTGRVNKKGGILFYAIVNDKVFKHEFKSEKNQKSRSGQEALMKQVFEHYQPGYDLDSEVSRENLVRNMAIFGTSPGSILNLACPGRIRYERNQATEENLASAESFNAWKVKLELKTYFDGEEVEVKEKDSKNKSFVVLKHLADTEILKKPAARQAYIDYMLENNLTDEERGVAKSESQNKQELSKANYAVKFDTYPIAARIANIATWSKTKLQIIFAENQIENRKEYCCSASLLEFAANGMAESKQAAKCIAFEGIYKQFLQKYGDVNNFKAAMKQKEETE